MEPLEKSNMEDKSNMENKSKIEIRSKMENESNMENKSNYMESKSLKVAKKLRLPVWYRTHTVIWRCLTVVLQVDLVYNLYQMWSDFVMRLLAIKELNSTLFGTMGYIGMYDAADIFTYVENHMLEMDRRHKPDNRPCSARKQAVLTQRDTTIRYYGYAVNIMFAILFFLCALLPYAQTCHKIVEAYLHDVTLGKDVSMIVYTYYPESFETIPLYTLFHNLLFFWYSSVVYLWAMDLRAVLLAFECLNTECKLLQVSIDEELDCGEVKSGKKKFEDLRKKLGVIVADHQSLCRNTQMLDKYLRNILMGFMNVYGIQMCLILIFIVEIKAIGPRLRYLFRYCMALSLMWIACSKGESVTEGGFAIRTALANCPWTDKPEWFKKTILTMLIRTTRELVIKPYGLYTINMNCIANIIKGSYTYMNVVNNFRQ